MKGSLARWVVVAVITLSGTANAVTVAIPSVSGFPNETVSLVLTVTDGYSKPSGLMLDLTSPSIIGPPTCTIDPGLDAAGFSLRVQDYGNGTRR
jgi:hypothetical protein